MGNGDRRDGCQEEAEGKTTGCPQIGVSGQDSGGVPREIGGTEDEDRPPIYSGGTKSVGRLPERAWHPAAGWGESGVMYRPIPSSPPYYAGDDGSIWYVTERKARKRKLSTNPNRRFYVFFSWGMRSVSRLVCEAFHGSCPDGMECCHNDGDCQNNRASNLRWDTRESNVRDIHLHGGNKGTRGERNCNARLTTKTVKAIMRRWAEGGSQSQIARELGLRRARVCEIVLGYSWCHVTGLPKRSRRSNKKAV